MHWFFAKSITSTSSYVNICLRWIQWVWTAFELSYNNIIVMDPINWNKKSYDCSGPVIGT